MRGILCILAWLAVVTPAFAQDWSGVAPVLRRDLADGRQPLSSFFITDAPDPVAAARALGIAYVHIEGSAGNASLEAGLFRKSGAAWVLHRRVEGLFGYSPRDPQLGPDGFFLTTDTLGPNDPRCCPSVPTRWYVAWGDGPAERVE